MEPSEQRKYRRLPDHIDVKYRIISLGENPGGYIELRGDGHSENVSEGGMLLESHEIIPPGTFLEVEIKLHGSESPIYLRGRVVRTEEIIENRRYEIGVKFTHYFEKDREMLHTHLKDLATQLFRFE